MPGRFNGLPVPGFWVQDTASAVANIAGDLNGDISGGQPHTELGIMYADTLRMHRKTTVEDSTLGFTFYINTATGRSFDVLMADHRKARRVRMVVGPLEGTNNEYIQLDGAFEIPDVPFTRGSGDAGLTVSCTMNQSGEMDATWSKATANSAPTGLTR